jgi:nucleoside-diphosphate-sugar epimerase
MAQSALVMGGSGYVGHVLIDELQRHGIQCLNGDIVAAEEPLCPYEAIDIRDPRAIARAIRTHRPDLVINSTAAVPLVRSPRLFEEVNVGGTHNLLQASLEAGVPKVIHVSTCGIFGVPKQVPLTETSPPTPVEAYGRSKTQGEAIVRDFVARGLDVTVLRPRSMMGYRRLGIFHVAFELIRCGKSMWTFGPGTNRIQFLHVRDFARAVHLASQRRGPALYNVGAERFGTIREDLEGLVRAAGARSKVRAFPRALAVGLMSTLARLRLSPVVPYQYLLYASDIYFDVSLVQRDLGWRSEYSNVDMLLESYQWYERAQAEPLGHDDSVQRAPLKLGAVGLLRYLPF